jgi:hypothetical protein
VLLLLSTFWRTIVPCWLSDSENESDDEETPDLGKNIFIEPDIVESSDDSDGEETLINSVVVMEEVEISGSGVW